MIKHRHLGSYWSRTPRGRQILKKRPIHEFTIIKKRQVLHKPYRKIFQDLDKKPFETGGYMDFNEKGLEKADIYMGQEGYVDIDINPDFETDWHVHNPSGDKFTDKLNFFPSPGDLQASAEFPSQVMLIFHSGNVTVAKKNRNFTPDPVIISQIELQLRKDAMKLPISKLFEKFKPEYKKLGLDMELIGRNKDIVLPIDTVEPVRT